MEVRKLSQADGLNNSDHHYRNESEQELKEISLWEWRWEEVDKYLVVSLFLLIAALVKLAYHHTAVHRHVPESWSVLLEICVY